MTPDTRSADEILGALAEANPGLMDENARKYEVEIAGDSRGSKVDHWIINRDGNGRVSYFNEF